MSIAERFSMRGRRALVTGSSMSMGREIAILFAEAGADVAVHHAAEVDRKLGLEQAAGEVARGIAALGRRTVVIDADLAVAGQGRRAVEEKNLALGLARRYARHGVTVNNLAPGLVATVRNRDRREDPAPSSAPTECERRAWYSPRLERAAWRTFEEQANPMRRAGRPEEIAPAALLLCSDAGSFITGADLDVDGGGRL